jgi:NAD-dependent deacetylase
LLNFASLFSEDKMTKQKVVVFSGSGISAESGLRTFRDSDGLWEEYNVYEVATPQAWEKNPALVNEFYNARRRQVRQAQPNDAHYALADLEQDFEVQIITQNIDDLHERAGSSNVLHLHGEIMKCRSSADPTLIYDVEGDEIQIGQFCDKGSQLRPHVVWFGEMVTEMDRAMNIASGAEIFIIVGTSLNVYPAAGLVTVAPAQIPKYLIDPNAHELGRLNGVQIIAERAGTGVPRLVQKLREGIPHA